MYHAIVAFWHLYAFSAVGIALGMGISGVLVWLDYVDFNGQRDGGKHL